MSTNAINRMPFLRTSRLFVEDLPILAREVDKSYLDIAAAVNDRTIGIFPVNRPAITGNSYFLIGQQRRQSLRQIYSFNEISAGNSISIDIKDYSPPYIQIYGVCETDAVDSRPIPYISNTANDNIEIRVDESTTSIIVTVGSASANVTSGIVVLEWISNF